jgi:hypothetical protein
VGLADKFTGLLIEQMLLIGYIMEKQGANQDKSRMGLAREFIQEEAERELDSRLSWMPLAVHGNDEPSAFLARF